MSAQSYLTLRNPTDSSLPGSSVHGILQAKIWSRLSFPSPGGLPDSGIELTSVSPALASGFFTTEPPGKSLERKQTGKLKIFRKHRG